jgi:DNA ligase D-like protein (predicted polymerase)
MLAVCWCGGAEWTHYGKLRQPRFLGLRPDKRPQEVRRERPEPLLTNEVRDTRQHASPRLLDFMGRTDGEEARALEAYAHKRHFGHTPEPRPQVGPSHQQPIFVRGRPVRYVLVNDQDTLLYLVNQGTLTFHVWFSRIHNLDRPDFVLFDLDPGEATFRDVMIVAKQLHARLQAEAVASFVKTSGKTGLHVLVPWEDKGGYAEARDWARQLAHAVVAELPGVATLAIRKAHRRGRVYVDVLQNARGHHAVPPYVLRAVPQACVSTPLAWDELTPHLHPQAFTLRTMFERLASQPTDPMGPLLAYFRREDAKSNPERQG